MNQMIRHLIGTGSRKLFCFPFAGGNSISFRPLSKHFTSSDLCVYAMEPSGHGSNRGPLLQDLNQIIDMYLEALLPELTTPFFLFGHSMGGWVTFLLTQRLEAKGIFPEAVFISAINPPDLPRQKHGHLPDPEFLDYVVSLGGIPQELLAEKELIDYFLPIFRADFLAIEGYQHQNPALLKSPVHIFGGTEDKGNPPEKLQNWTNWAPHAKFHWFQGKHMFLLDQADQVANQILNVIKSQVFYG